MPGIWSSGGDLSVARSGIAGCGTQATALAFGGRGTVSVLKNTEEYDGDTWSTGGDLIKERQVHGSCGTQIAGLGWGGLNDKSGIEITTEEYNGTAWSSGGDLSFVLRDMGSCGTQTAGLSFGGVNSTIKTEEYNGTSWSDGGDLITGRTHLAGAGTQSAGLSFGGTTHKLTEEYNGTAWSSGGDLSLDTRSPGGCGTQDLGLCFGGYSSASQKTEEYNGTAWSGSGDLIYGRYILGGAGSQEAGLCFGGWGSSGRTVLTEEYDIIWSFDGKIRIKDEITKLFDGKLGIDWISTGLFDGWIYLFKSSFNLFDGRLLINVDTGLFDGKVYVDQLADNLFDGELGIYLFGTWVVAGSMLTGRHRLAGCGLQNAGLNFGGYNTTSEVDTEEYNGISWAVGGDLNTGVYFNSGCGTQTAALCFSGTKSNNQENSTAEEYDGTSWESGGGLASKRYGPGGCGTQTAGLCIGGNVSDTPVISCEEYNGTAWSSGGDLPAARFRMAACGTQSAGLSFGGLDVSSVVSDLTTEYNGVAWSAGGSLSAAKRDLGGCGSQYAGLNFGGYSTATVGTSEKYDGTSWIMCGTLITARSELAGGGTLVNGLAFGGVTALTNTEEYTDLISDITTPFDGKLQVFSGVLLSKFDGKLELDIYLVSEFDGRSSVYASIGGWTAEGDMISGRAYSAGAGLSVAALSFGGNLYYDDPPVNTTEEYNSSTWSGGGALSEARLVHGGCGTQTAALAFGGMNTSLIELDSTEEYNGTVWSAGGDLTAARRRLGGCGTQTAALSAGGHESQYLVERYNGTAWSVSDSLVSSASQAVVCGSQEDAVVNSGLGHHTQVYNGSVWVMHGDPLQDVDFPSFCGGTSLAVMSCGIYHYESYHEHFTGATEVFYGSDWVVGTNRPTSCWGPGSCGTAQNGLVFGGHDTPYMGDYAIKLTYSYVGPTYSRMDFDGRMRVYLAPGAWYVAPDNWNSRRELAGCGTKLAGLVFGGYDNFNSSNDAEKYNGLTWVYSPDMPQASRAPGGFGTQDAAVCAGGIDSELSWQEHDGSSWSVHTSLPYAVWDLCAAGTQTAGLIIGGSTTAETYIDDTSEFNGTVWSAGGDLLVARHAAAGCGLQTAALVFGGRGIGGITLADTEEYNGTMWSASEDILLPRSYLAGCGVVEYAMCFGGFDGTNRANTEEFDGSAWAVSGDMLTARQRLGGLGSVPGALSFCGYIHPNLSGKTEEYEGVLQESDYFDGKLRAFALETDFFDGRLNVDVISTGNFDGKLRLKDTTASLFDGLILVNEGFDGRIRIKDTGDAFFDGRMGVWFFSSDVFDGKIETYLGNVWTIVTNYGSARESVGAAGVLTAGVVWGGRAGPHSFSQTRAYNGVSWTEKAVMPQCVYACGDAGVLAAALTVAGTSDVVYDESYHFDGSFWSAGGTTNYERYGLAGCGLLGAAIAVGGRTFGSSTPLKYTEEYNGTTWSAGGDLLVGKLYFGACGTQTAAMCVRSIYTEEYNGTIWSAGGTPLSAKFYSSCVGTQTAGLCIGGWTGSVYVPDTDEYDGTSWASRNAMNFARCSVGAFGSVDDAVAACGLMDIPPSSAIGYTEEYSTVSQNVFDGELRVKDVTSNVFDGELHVVHSTVDLFNGKLDVGHIYVFDGKIEIEKPRGWLNLLGGTGEPSKLDALTGFGESYKIDIQEPLGISVARRILTGLGQTLEYLLYIPLAQNERQLLVSDLSDYVNAIQILINRITVGDPFFGRLPLLTSLQSESGIQLLVNELSGILIGLQNLTTALTENVSSHVFLINELALQSDIQSLLVLLGSMPDQAATHISPKLGVPLEGAPPSEYAMCIYLDGVPINNQITDLSFVMDRGVTFDVLSFSSTDVHLYAKLQEIVGNKDSTLEVQYKGTSWFFLIEEVSGYELNFNAWGRSIAAAKSDAPFEDSVNFVLETDTLASIVAEDLVPNLSITWNVVDWTIMADWSVDGTPVQMLKELADSVGAVVRSYPDGTGFYVEEKYTTRPVDLPYAASVEDYDRDVDLMSLDTSRDLGTGVNAVTVHGYSPFSKYSIKLEAGSCVDVGNPAIIKVYPALEGVGYKLVASDGVPVYQYSQSEEHVETVNFVGGKGSVSYPIMSIKSITWDGVTPAGFECTAGQDEILLTDDTLAAVGEVVYSTRHDVWHGEHSGEGQLLVVCYLDEGGGIVAKVYFGEGDREADDIDRPTLTSTEAAMAAGQAFLDDTSYNRRLRAIVVPCSDVFDGDVVSVSSDLSGVTGNTFVLKHRISVDVVDETLKITSNLDVVQFEV